MSEPIETWTDEALRVKCAELCGWKYVHPKDWKTELESRGLHTNSHEALTNAGFRHKIYAFPHDLLDYCRDLNAMHEAEKTLTEWQDREYRDALITETVCKEHRATARQRCIAFIKVKEAK